ncbi:hypothetical protein [Jatrophihabitans fulvus]
MSDTLTTHPSRTRTALRVCVVLAGIVQLLLGVVALVVWLLSLLRVTGCDLAGSACADASDAWTSAGAAVAAVIATGIGVLVAGTSTRRPWAWLVAGALAAVATVALVVLGSSFVDAVGGR